MAATLRAQDIKASGQLSVSWYSRPLDKDPIRTAPKKPHQQNTENLRKLRECEAQIAKLRKEDEDWTKVISSFNTFHAALLDSGAKLPPGNEPVIMPESFVEEIDLNLLTADERSLWEKHCKPKEGASTPGKSPKAGAQANGAGQSGRDSNKWMTEMMSTLETEVSLVVMQHESFFVRRIFFFGDARCLTKWIIVYDIIGG